MIHPKRLRKTIVLSLVFSGLVMMWAPNTRAQEKSLYERLGGYDGIAKVVDDFIGRLVADKQFEKFFIGQSTDSRKRIRNHVIEQFCVATGGPCVYTGRDMKTSHGGLGITKAEWDGGAKHLIAALDKYKLDEKSKGEVVAFVSTLEKDIVEKR